jgi:diguanylate cyclase (GGDEF)-like protein/PAS domain S-box-containing protein
LRQLRAVAGWIRANSIACLVAIVAMAAVVGAGALVLSIADREDDLRETKTEIVELSRFVAGFREQTLAAFQESRPKPADLNLHRQIAELALPTARALEFGWGNPEVAGIVAPTHALVRLSGVALVAGSEGREAAAKVALDRLPARTDALSARLDGANDAISAEIAHDQSQAKVLTLLITGSIGLFLGSLILVLSTMWRRRQQSAAERRAALHGERRLQALVRHGSDLITVLSPAGKVLFVAGPVESMLGSDASELEGEDLAGRLHPDDVPTLAALCHVGEGESPARELRLRRCDGGWRTCEARATSLLGDELWNGIVLNIWDVSERVALEDRLRHQAFHDDLTALANRVLFNERLKHALIRAARDGSAVSVLIIDLDDFKAINDSLGHPCGDELLREVAARLDEALRGADTVARLGGDEFGVIFDDSLSIAADEEAAQRITAALAAPFQLAGRCLPVSASVGIARAAAGQATPSDLIRDADLAMYAAKGEQKGSIAVYRADMYLDLEERLGLKSDLLDAAAGDGEQFALFFQPVVMLDSGKISGLEALLRWNHPTRGPIGPAEFIPIAEETGAIVPIGRRVLRQACAEAQRWQTASDGRPLNVSVNVSARQLRDDALLEHVREALAATGLLPHRLILEITETQLMHDVGQAVATLRAVKELGVYIAIDDFGTGYSSLSQLQKLPVDILKVDREFTGSGEDGGAEHPGLLSAVMEIGDSLGLRTVAEGIETPAQLHQLRALNYRFGQGYLFSRPVPAERVPDLLATPMLPDEEASLLLPARAGEGTGVDHGYVRAVQHARAAHEVSRYPLALRTRRDLRRGRGKHGG